MRRHRVRAEHKTKLQRFLNSTSLEYPADWNYKIGPTPDGGQLHMFMGPQENNALAYCHTRQQALHPSLPSRILNASEKKRMEWFAASTDHELLFSLYNNLPSAQGFKLIHTGAVALGKMPSFVADFVFRVPQGFIYRVRSHYTFWKTSQLSVWCQTVSRSESAGDNAFQYNLANFQRFAASIRVD